MKRVIIMMAMAAVLILAACGSDNGESEEGTNTEEEKVKLYSVKLLGQVLKHRHKLRNKFLKKLDTMLK